MTNIAIITDTDSSLPPEMAAKHGVRQVPIGIHFEGESNISALEMNDRMLFEKVDKLNCLPTTTAPNPADFINVFEQAFQDGADAIVCVCVSSQVSSTYDSAVTAKGNFPRRDIRVIDSLNLTMAQGFMVLEAAEAAARNASMDEIVSCVEQAGKRMLTYAVVPTLKYLALSGRVSKFVSGLANTLNIKPILTINDGKLDLLEKVRTQKKAVERLLELLAGGLSDKRIKRIAIVHSNEPVGAVEMELLLRGKFACPDNITIAEFTAGLSVHTGAGVVGVVVQTE